MQNTVEEKNVLVAPSAQEVNKPIVYQSPEYLLGGFVHTNGVKHIPEDYLCDCTKRAADLGFENPREVCIENAENWLPAFNASKPL